MNRRTKIAGLCAAAAVGLSSVAFATPAAAAVAPSCVDVIGSGRSWGFPYVKIKNNCSTTKRVKVIWAWAPDSSCKSLAPGATWKHSTGMAGRFDGLQSC